MSFGDDSYHTQFLREMVVSKIDEAKEQSRGKFEKSSQDMEAYIFQQSTSRNEYMSLVFSTIRYIKENQGSDEGTEDKRVNGEVDSSQQNGEATANGDSSSSNTAA